MHISQYCIQVIVLVGITMNLSNLYGYYKCAKEAGKKQGAWPTCTTAPLAHGNVALPLTHLHHCTTGPRHHHYCSTTAPSHPAFVDDANVKSKDEEGSGGGG